MHSFQEVIDLWPSLQFLADDVGVSIHVVRKWRERNRVPSDKWLDLIAAAKKRRFRSVTLEMLAGFGKEKAA